MSRRSSCNAASSDSVGLPTRSVKVLTHNRFSPSRSVTNAANAHNAVIDSSSATTFVRRWAPRDSRSRRDRRGLWELMLTRPNKKAEIPMAKRLSWPCERMAVPPVRIVVPARQKARRGT